MFWVDLFEGRFEWLKRTVQEHLGGYSFCFYDVKVVVQTQFLANLLDQSVGAFIGVISLNGLADRVYLGSSLWIVPDINEEVSNLVWSNFATIILVQKFGQNKLEVVHSNLVFEHLLRVIGDDELLQVKRGLLGVDLPWLSCNKITPKLHSSISLSQMFHSIFVDVLAGDVLASQSSLVGEFDLGQERIQRTIKNLYCIGNCLLVFGSF